MEVTFGTFLRNRRAIIVRAAARLASFRLFLLHFRRVDVREINDSYAREFVESEVFLGLRCRSAGLRHRFPAAAPLGSLSDGKRRCDRCSIFPRREKKKVRPTARGGASARISRGLSAARAKVKGSRLRARSIHRHGLE